MSLRQAYEKTLQITSCFISQYSQVERKKSNYTILCTWGKWGNQKRCKLLKIPSSSSTYCKAKFTLDIWGVGCKIILYLSAREKQTRNSGSAFCGAAACLILDTGCTEDSCWKHLCSKSSNFTILQLKFFKI